MALRLYNSLIRTKEDFVAISSPRVSLYTCGPTVYNYQHVGNYRTYIFEDILVRTLAYLDFKVRRVMNITDVGHLTSHADEGEDKVETQAAKEGKTAWEVAEFYTQAFLKDWKQLNLLDPDVLCKATDHIPEQIDLIARLERKGFIYKISDGLYYDTAKFPAYGRMAGESDYISYLSGLKVGARVEANPEKRNPTDFAVWKFSPSGKKRHMEWDSPWGTGFPGWHIECSAMAMSFLGETIDIHCGGIDHVPVHHTNEIAQSEGATGKPFVRVWMHGEFLLMNNAKMAKSAGHFVTLSDLKDKGFSPLDYKYHCLTAHYRKQLDFTWESLEAAKTARRRLKDATRGRCVDTRPRPGCADFSQRFRAALADDLNAPAALAVVWDALKSDLPGGAKAAFIQEAESVLALDLLLQEVVELPSEVRALLERRAQARARKDFAESDRLRKQIEELGYLILDGKDGASVVKK